MNVLLEDAAEVLAQVLLEHRRIESRQHGLVVLHHGAGRRRAVELEHGAHHRGRRHGVVARDLVLTLQLADSVQRLVDVLQGLEIVLAHINAEQLVADAELELHIEIDRAGRFDTDIANGVVGVVVAANGALARDGTFAVPLNEGEVGEAVLVLLRLYQEIDALLILVEQVVVGIDLVEILGLHDDADVAEPEGLGGEFLEHVTGGVWVTTGSPARATRG